MNLNAEKLRFSMAYSSRETKGRPSIQLLSVFWYGVSRKDSPNRFSLTPIALSSFSSFSSTAFLIAT